MYVGLHVKYRLLSFLNTNISIDFRNILKYITFHEVTFRGSRVVPCGQTDGQIDGQRQTDRHIAKLTVAFRNFADVFNSFPWPWRIQTETCSS